LKLDAAALAQLRSNPEAPPTEQEFIFLSKLCLENVISTLYNIDNIPLLRTHRDSLAMIKRRYPLNDEDTATLRENFYRTDHSSLRPFIIRDLQNLQQIAQEFSQNVEFRGFATEALRAFREGPSSTAPSTTVPSTTA
jgi:hypothetical protein